MVKEKLDCFVLGLAQYRFGTVYVFSETSMLNHTCRFIYSCVRKYKPLNYKSAQFLVWAVFTTAVRLSWTTMFDLSTWLKRRAQMLPGAEAP